MKTIKTLLILAICSGSIYAQDNSGEIHGKLYDLDTKEAMAYSSIFVEYGNDKIGTTTDDEGRFIIKPLPPGTYTVYYMMLTGEKQPIIKDVKVKPSKIARSGMLYASAEILPDVEVMSYRIKLIDPEDPTAETIGAEQIAQSAVVRNPNALLASMNSRIKVSENGGMSIGGSREGGVVYLVDGIKQKSMNLPASAYESITLYTGGLPAKYGDTTSGVVIVESKSYFDYYRAWKAQQDQNNR